MDIKDFILIVGGLLIAAVIAHGFWIGWRARSEPLRLDIVPELVPENHDEMDRFRGELPNGGARPALSEQASLELEGAHDLSGEQAPLLLEPSAASSAARRALDLELLGDPQVSEPAIAKRAAPPKSRRRPKGPDLFTIPEGFGLDEDELQASTAALREPTEPTVDARANGPRRPRVTEVTLPGEAARAEADPAAETPVEELIMIHLLAPPGGCFDGEVLLASLRKQGLKFGEMNIFHRINPMLKSPVYSVANAVEPGFFDLSDMEAMSTPGVTFFLQLPGPEEPMAACEDMLTVAQTMAHQLGGELRDESRNRLTRQTANHLKQRVSDFALKRLSRKAL